MVGGACSAQHKKARQACQRDRGGGGRKKKSSSLRENRAYASTDKLEQVAACVNQYWQYLPTEVSRMCVVIGDLADILKVQQTQL